MSNSFGKNYGMNKKCMSVLTYLTEFILFLLKGFVDYVNIMNTNIIIKALILNCVISSIFLVFGC